MRLEAALRIAGRLPRVHPGLVAVYLLGFAALLAARAPLLIGGGLALALLLHQGRLQPLLAELSRIRPGDLAPGEPIPPELAAALEGLLSPAAVGLFVGGLTAAAIAWIVGTAVGAAGGVHAVAAGLDLRETARRDGGGPEPEAAVGADTGESADVVVAAVRGIRVDTRTFVGLGIARGAAGIGVPLAAFGLLGVLPSLVGSLLVLVALPGGVLAYFALGFAEQAAVLEGRGAASALRRSLAFVRDDIDAFVGYLGAGFLFLVGVFVVLVVVESLGASSAGGLVVLVAGPLLFDGFKTALFAGRTTPPETRVSVAEAAIEPGGDVIDPVATGRDRSAARDRSADRDRPAASDRSADRDRPAARDGVAARGAIGGLRVAGRRTATAAGDGLRAVGTFVRSHPFANLAAAGLLAGGLLAGWTLTVDLGLTLLAPGSREPVAIDPSSAGQIWVNNWTVAATSAYGGFALGIPVLVNLLFNGLLIGALAGVTDPAAFLALVVPHGIVELPAIAVAGGLGLVLGRRGLQAMRGHRGDGALAGDVRWAFDVLVGLAVVLLVAALIEALVTPLIGNAVL